MVLASVMRLPVPYNSSYPGGCTEGSLREVLALQAWRTYVCSLEPCEKISALVHANNSRYGEMKDGDEGVGTQEVGQRGYLELAKHRSLSLLSDVSGQGVTF